MPLNLIQGVSTDRCNKHRFHRQHHKLGILSSLHTDICGTWEGEGKISADVLHGNQIACPVIAPEDGFPLRIAGAIQSGLLGSVDTRVAIGIRYNPSPYMAQYGPHFAGMILLKCCQVYWQRSKGAERVIIFTENNIAGGWNQHIPRQTFRRTQCHCGGNVILGIRQNCTGYLVRLGIRLRRCVSMGIKCHIALSALRNMHANIC